MQQKKNKKAKQKYKSLGRLIGLTLNCGLSAFYYGFCMTYFNSIPFRSIIKIYHIEHYPRAATEGLLTGAPSFMGAFGSIMALFFVDRFSRRKCLAFSSACAIVLSLLLMIPHIWVLIGVRCMQGLLIGAISCITPLYINQMMPKSVSGPFWSFHQCLYVFGITFSFILSIICAQFSTPIDYWRIVFGFPIVTSLIQIYNFIYIFPYQSPKFLIMHDKEDQARETLNYLYEDRYVDRVFTQIIQAVQYAEENSSDEGQNSKVQNNDLATPLKKSFTTTFDIQLKQMKKQGGKLQNAKSLKQYYLRINKQKQQNEHHSPNNKAALFIAVYLAIQQPFLGGPTVIQYSGDLIEGIFPKLENIFPIIINTTGIIGSLLSILVLAKWGRRQIILFGSLGEAICLFILFFLCHFVNYESPHQGAFSIRVAIALLFIAVRLILSTTYAPVSDLYTAEIVQAKVLPICSLFQWIVMGVVSTFFPVIANLRQGNPLFAFAIFSVVTIISFFIDRHYVLQTKNKSQIQIRKQYDQKFPY